MFLDRNSKKFNSKIIRLRLRGHKHASLFEIVVMSKHKRRQSIFFDKIGYFNPKAENRLLYIDSYKLAYWVSKGASIHKNVKKYIIKFLVKN